MPEQDRPADAHPPLLDLVIEQYERLIRLVMSVVGCDRPTAEDAVQTVTVKIMAGRAFPRDGEAVLAYLNRAVVNQGRTAAKKAQQEAEREARYAELRGHNVAADAIVTQILMLDALRDLQTLSPEQREAYFLRHFEGLTYDQIAERTGVKGHTVDNRLRAAKAQLDDLRAKREASADYASLLVFLHPVATRAARIPTQGAGVICTHVTAGVAAFAAAVAMTAVPGRVEAPQVSPHAQVPAVAFDLPRQRTHADGTSDDRAPGVPRTRGLTPPAGAGGGAAGLAPADRAGLCAAVVCVADADGPKTPPLPTPPPRPGGDELRVRGVKYGVTQAVTPVCWAIPDQPLVTCTTGDEYMLPRQEPTGASPKSPPSAPHSGESWKGTQR